MTTAPRTADEPEPFEHVFRRLLPDAVRAAKRILGNETMAEDAAAEAFARALWAWKKVGTSEYRDAWIMRVTANVAVDMIRRRRRLFAIGLSLAAERPAAGDDDADASRLVLAAALAALPRRQREVVILRYLEGLPEEEVARALGVSLGTVKKNAFRARETLRLKLGHEFAT